MKHRMQIIAAGLIALATGTAQAATLQTQRNLCLDVRDGRFVNGGSVQLWQCSGGTNQQWTLSQGELKVGNKCLDVADGGAVAGSRLQLWDCVSGNNNQQWEVAGSAIRHKGTNLCLDVKDGSYANGSSVQLWTCDFRSTGNQVFGIAQVAQSSSAQSTFSSGASTFYGYPVIGIDEFIAKNSECAWIKDAVVAAAKDLGLNATFLATACIVESSCTDPSNGFGPFQFSDDGAWNQYGGSGKNRRNVWDAAYGAARYFKDLLSQNNGNLDAALRAYNGPLSQGGNPNYQKEYRCWMSGGNAWETGI